MNAPKKQRTVTQPARPSNEPPARTVPPTPPPDPIVQPRWLSSPLTAPRLRLVPPETTGPGRATRARFIRLGQLLGAGMLLSAGVIWLCQSRVEPIASAAPRVAPSHGPFSGSAPPVGARLRGPAGVAAQPRTRAVGEAIPNTGEVMESEPAPEGIHGRAHVLHPPGEVIVDGRPSGRMTPVVLQLTPGRHRVQVRRLSGTITATRVVDIRGGERVRLAWAIPEATKNR